MTNAIAQHQFPLETDRLFHFHRCSKILVNVFSAWSASKEWMVNLPKEESTVLLSVSNTLLCIVSDLNYVRTWSLGGLQRHIISLSG